MWLYTIKYKLRLKGRANARRVSRARKNLRYCQSIMKARKGESFIIPADKHACVVGASSLGIIPVPEK